MNVNKCVSFTRSIAISLLAGVVSFTSSVSAQNGAVLVATHCYVCHNDTDHPLGLVYNAAGNAAIIEAEIAKGMSVTASAAELASIATWLDGIKPVINMAQVPHDSSRSIPLEDIKVQASAQHASWKIISSIVTVSPTTKGTVTYAFALGFDQPSLALYKPFPGASGRDSWTYQGVGTAGSATTVRTATVSIANADGTWSPLVDANQHGLTGSWYEPATSGQGFEVEIYPDLSGTGNGLAQLSWFTFDTAAGAADRQRWYTASGAVLSGRDSIDLTIYRNTGGNFDAGPITSAETVGSATLSFDSCTSGQLDYRFTDGSARAGSIPLTRITQAVTCAAAGSPPVNSDFAFSGNWYDPATSGQGITVEVNPDSSTLFFAWYTYADQGAALGASGQRWYTGQAGYVAGARAIAVTLYETTGGMFDRSVNPPPSTIPVGAGTLTLLDCTKAVLDFNFTGGSSGGKSGSIDLVRVGPAPKTCIS